MVARKAYIQLIIMEPQLTSKSRGLCTVDDISGKMVTLVFRGTNYSNLNFDITDRAVPGVNIGTSLLKLFF